MLITETFKDNGLSTSFEVFPPKNNAPYKPVEDAVDKLAVYHPDFISVTYGAGGGTSVNTPKIAAHIQNDLSIPALAHLTCASSTKKELDKIINDLGAAGVNNILALRGDLPDGYDPDNPDYYHYAYELNEAIKSKGDFCIGAACYPECHPEAESLQKDIENLKIKVDNADFYWHNVYKVTSRNNMRQNKTISVKNLVKMFNRKKHTAKCDEWECALRRSVSENRSRLRAGTGSDANSTQELFV